MNPFVLKTLPKDLKAYGGFQWSSEVGATVTAPDWSPEPVCGKGLHGFLWGEGDRSLANFDADSVWMIVEPQGEIIDLDGKVKFESCVIKDVGTQAEITAKLYAMRQGAIIGLTLTAGHCSTLTGGDRSTLTGGSGSTLTAGNHSTLTGGDRSTLTGGSGSTLTGRHHSTLTGGDYSTLTGGDYSTLTAGNHSTLTGGDDSTLTGGYGSTLTGGNRSTLTGGDYSTLTGGGGDSTLTGGENSILSWRYWDGKRYRLKTVYTDEDVEAGKVYKFENGEIKEVQK